MGRLKVCTYVMHDNRISPHTSKCVLIYYNHYPSVPIQLKLNRHQSLSKNIKNYNVVIHSDNRDDIENNDLL